MKRTRIRLAAALLAAALAAPAFGEEGAGSLASLIDGLQRLQVKVAFGDADARAATARQLEAIGAAIAAEPPSAWADRNAQAEAVIYLFSGGQPKVVARLIEANLIPKDQQTLTRGALAYVMGREKEGQKLLSDIDPTTLDVRLAGQFAYVQSIIAARRSVDKALELLDLARVLSPSTLVEEAALRREILLLGSRKAADRVAALTRAYFSRFGASPYAPRFFSDLVIAIEHFGVIDDRDAFEQFADAAQAMPADYRRAFYLSFARAEAMEGKFALAGAAASYLLPETDRESAEENRRLLYDAPGHLFGVDFDLGTLEISKISPSKLNREDRKLFSVLTYARLHVHEMPAPYAGDVEPAHAEGDAALDEIDQTIQAARAALPPDAAAKPEASK